MAEFFIGEIRLVPFNFAPQDWALCDGSLISIAQNVALFDLIGTTYGGDGQVTFALPDLRSRVAMHIGASNPIGDRLGTEEVTIDTDQLPTHQHLLAVSSAVGSQTSPSAHVAATAPDGLGYVYAAYSSDSSTPMASNSIVPTGGGQPHSNIQPYLALNYIIALFGIFPSHG